MNKSTVLLSAFCVLGAGSTAWFAHEWRQQSDRIAELERQIAARPISPPIVVAADHPEPSISAEAASKPTPATTASPQARPDASAYLQSWQQRQREMLRDPAYRETQRAEGRRRFARIRSDAIRITGMTPEQADRVIDLWVERNLRFTELSDFTGHAPSPEAQAELKRAGDAEEEELKRLLGEDMLSRWHHYLQTDEERAEVVQFSSQLADAATPLTSEQADALVESLYSERQTRSAEYEQYAKAAGITDRNVVAPQDRQRWLDLEKEANARIHSTMAETFSAAQLASLDAALAARLAPIEAALQFQLQNRASKGN